MAERSRGKKSGGEFADLLRKGKETYEAGEQFEDQSFIKVPAGTYEARLQLAEFRLSQNKNLMLHREHIILTGEHAGVAVFDNMMYGMSEFGDGKIRHFIKTTTGEDCPDDPADLEDIVKDLNDKSVYDCKLKVSYSKDKNDPDGDGFTNVTVLECFDVDDSIDVEKLKPGKADKEDKEEKPSRGKKEEKDDNADLIKRAQDFIEKEDEGFKAMKKAKRDPDDLDDLKAEIGSFTYEEDKLSDEDAELLKELELEDCIEKAEKKSRSKR